MNNHLSFTQISTYLSCPLKYYFQYVKQIPWPFKPEGLVFGSAIHRALEHYYLGRKDGREAPLKELLAIYDAAWEKESGEHTIQYKNGNTPDSLRQTAESMLTTFTDTVRPGQILAVEESFSVELADPDTGVAIDIPFEGRIDLIEQTPNGIAVIDHKTAAKAYDQNRIEHDLQLTAYSYVMSRKGYEPKDIIPRFDVLMKNGACKFIQYPTHRTQNDYRRFFRIAHSVVNGIRAESFYPQKSWMCNGCVFAKECEKW